MSYTALYRKWRPSGFDDVKGQDHIVQTLKNQITSGRIGHAYLFCGTRGTGKTSIAKIFAKSVNCEHPVDGSPCNECGACRNISSGSSMNVVEIDAASNNGVENIREIREQVQYPPTEGRYRVYIIDEVHMLSTGAFNALLKTLEEPPSYVIFILATTEVHKIPITVLSRCQRYDFKRITIDTITARLKELADAEQIQVEDKALRYIAKAADGSMRDALSLLDQCVAFHYGKLLTYDNVLEVLGAVDSGVFSELLRAVIGKQTTECMKKLEEMVIQGRELGQFVTDFIWYLRNLLVLKTADDAENMLEISEDNLKQLREEAGMIDGETLMRYIRIFSELSGQLRYASQKRVLIELALIKLTKPQMEPNLDSILQRLSELEERLDEGMPMSQDAMQEMLRQMGGGMGGAASGGFIAGGQGLSGDPGMAPVSSGGACGAAGIPGPADTAAAQPQKVTIPKAQLEDLNLIRQDWGKIIRDLGGPIRPSFRDTVLEPSGDSCLCIVFSGQQNYDIGSRPTVLGQLEKYVEEQYGKEMYFKARLKNAGERLNTIYVSDEELKQAIHMDITVED
ncbi:DNA polymerase III subunit gamma/tau [Clostridium sp. AN503]|uniref:DNA polymerase III subunit gamma/tau n=1 Tax=Clostridium sp. AN503 TaxID=3160598 RepID=UPI00345B0637